MSEELTSTLPNFPSPQNAAELNQTAQMSTKSIKRKWLKTKIALNETVQKILEINRYRKRMQQLRSCPIDRDFDEELKVLNATAEMQSRVLQHYGRQLQKTA